MQISKASLITSLVTQPATAHWNFIKLFTFEEHTYQWFIAYLQFKANIVSHKPLEHL